MPGACYVVLILVLIVVVTLVLVGFRLRQQYRQYRYVQDKRKKREALDTRFQEAKLQLESDDVKIRCSGAKALGKLVYETGWNAPNTIRDILCEFVRVRAVPTDRPFETSRLDIQEALTALTSMWRYHWPNLSKLDLSGLDLRNMDFENSDLSCTDLSGTRLELANFYGTDLSSCNLANVQGITDFSMAFQRRGFPVTNLDPSIRPPKTIEYNADYDFVQAYAKNA